MDEPNMTCPCGSQLRAGLEFIDYLDHAALDALVPALEVDNWAPILSWLLGTPVDLRILCASPPPPPTLPTATWFTNPLLFADELLALVNAVRWPLVCECVACPPVVDCSGGTSYTVGQPDGYFEAGSCWEYKIHLLDADVYMQASGCSCAGNFTGDTFIEFKPPQNLLIPNPHYPESGPEFIGGCGGVTEYVIALTGSGAGQTATCNEHTTYGTVTIWQNGGGGEPNYPWPELPATVEPLPAPPACTEAAQCEAIDYLGRTITELIWQTAAIAQRTVGISQTVQTIDGPYDIAIPGLSTNITGTLSTVLPKLFQALAPVTQDQLTTEWTELVTTSQSIDVTGMAILVCYLSTVPNYYGQRAGVQPLYWNTGVHPAPARVTLQTADGALSTHWLDNVGTTIIPVPPLVISATVDLQPNVEVTVTGQSRAV